jgi:hypothetical protein
MKSYQQKTRLAIREKVTFHQIHSDFHDLIPAGKFNLGLVAKV